MRYSYLRRFSGIFFDFVNTDTMSVQYLLFFRPPCGGMFHNTSLSFQRDHTSRHAAAGPPHMVSLSTLWSVQSGHDPKDPYSTEPTFGIEPGLALTDHSKSAQGPP